MKVEATRGPLPPPPPPPFAEVSVTITAQTKEELEALYLLVNHSRPAAEAVARFNPRASAALIDALLGSVWDGLHYKLGLSKESF